MAVVNVTINGRVHEIACDDSQTKRVEELGRLLDQRAQTIAKQVGPVPDVRLLVMLALFLADEVADSRAELERLQAQVEAAADGDANLAEGIGQLAGRIENIADLLERA